MKGHSNIESIRHDYNAENIIQAKNMSNAVVPELLCHPHFIERRPGKK
ncbi:hypothetical protein [Vibrio diabolicus]|uniref:Uncharacterized protein n=1 Tax=Vibrio diabolicus TaxID=50719 RepID=A0AA92LUW7_9VIBR|nr:hypothetical protein [Vibrio diabolicus]QRG81451.1 hypothetical protein JOS67_00270 [Vibrio diabolicus]